MIKRLFVRMWGKFGLLWSYKSIYFINFICNFYNELKSIKVNIEEGNVMNIFVNKIDKNVFKENIIYK